MCLVSQGRVPEGNTAPGTFCMTEVKMNNDTVGLWHFKTYKGPYPGRTCVSRYAKTVTYKVRNILDRTSL